MRIVRFYVSCPPPSSLLLLLVLLLAGPHRSQWASPDLICQLLIVPDRCRPPRASTGESLSAVGLAGPQPARFGALWASPDLNRPDSEHCGPPARFCAPWPHPPPPIASLQQLPALFQRFPSSGRKDDTHRQKYGWGQIEALQNQNMGGSAKALVE